jgi:glycosyltransferase involved in cell wall biosynthesis
MTLSIIIPVYNAENFLSRCIDSLMHQNLDVKRYEILLVDDGSQDNSYAVIKEMEQAHSNVRGYHKENGGVADARNYGIDRASGTYLYFLDGDDYLAYNTLHIILESMEQNNLDILCFESIKTTAADRTKSDTGPITENPEVTDGITYIAKKGFQFEVWRYIIRREFFYATGIRFALDKALEDPIFTVRLFIAAKRMAKIPVDVHRYKQEPTSVINRPGRTHAERILSDLGNLAVYYNDLIREYKLLEHPYKTDFLNQLEAKKQFFAYYSIVRAYSGNFSFKYIWIILQRMRPIKAYPFTALEHKDDKLAQRLQYIFNRKFLLYLFFNGFRPLSNFKNKIRSILKNNLRIKP